MVPTTDNTALLGELVERLEVLVPLLEQSAAPEYAAASRKGEYLDAAAVAERYGLSREWVYRHKRELGGWPIGKGARPRWRFDAAEVESALRGPAPTPHRAKPRKRRPSGSTTTLLPINGGRSR